MSTVYHRPADPSGDDSYVRPLFADRCQAGFPSPATDYAEQELDLNSYCISRPAATFFLRASGESMNQADVQNGDLLVVDRAEKPQHGDIVIAEIDGEFTVGRPPQLPPGDEQVVPFALNMPGLVLPRYGSYSIVVEVDSVEHARLPFRLAPRPAGTARRT